MTLAIDEAVNYARTHLQQGWDSYSTLETTPVSVHCMLVYDSSVNMR